jgi:hypothetical protein
MGSAASAQGFGSDRPHEVLNRVSEGPTSALGISASLGGGTEGGCLPGRTGMWFQARGTSESRRCVHR